MAFLSQIAQPPKSKETRNGAGNLKYEQSRAAGPNTKP